MCLEFLSNLEKKLAIIFSNIFYVLISLSFCGHARPQQFAACAAIFGIHHIQSKANCQVKSSTVSSQKLNRTRNKNGWQNRKKILAYFAAVCYTVFDLFDRGRERLVRVPQAGSERVRSLRAPPAGQGPSAGSRKLEGKGLRPVLRRACRADRVKIRECAGCPANAGGTAEASSFVPV